MTTSIDRGRRLLGKIMCHTVCAASLVPPFAVVAQRPLTYAAPVAANSGDSCSRLSKVAIGQVDIISATSEPAGDPPADAKSWYGTINKLPAFCRVVGIARPSQDSSIGFELWLPSGDWDGRLHGIGIGGFAGLIDYDALASAIKGGQAGLATDTGHKGEMMESKWANGHPEKVLDYGYRAIHASTVAGKRLVEAFYGRAAVHAYFVGCSGGGRQGLMEAARYPEDYDGVVAGAPAASWTDLAMSMANAYQAQLPVGAALRDDQMPFLQAEVIHQCDRLDGQIDGLIADASQCRLDTAKLACRTSASERCLSKPQVAALERIYAGGRDSRGRQVAAGYPPSGSESGKYGWAAYILNGPSLHSGGAAHVDGLFGDFIQHPFASAATFDFDKDPARLKAELSAILDAPSNLARFLGRGGKLILWHGWADPAIPPTATLHYYADARAHSGPLAPNAIRLFMVPNVQHCGGGNGPASFGQDTTPSKQDQPTDHMVAALQDWVERGHAPTAIVATRGTGFYDVPPEGPSQKRLLCPWPSTAVLRPGGDAAKAESYSCKSST